MSKSDVATTTAIFGMAGNDWVSRHILWRECLTWGTSHDGNYFTVVGQTQSGRMIAARVSMPAKSRQFRFSGSVFQLGWEYSRPGQDAIIAGLSQFIASFEDAEWAIGLWLGPESPERRFRTELTAPETGWKNWASETPLSWLRLETASPQAMSPQALIDA